jgi:hypothetical protein
MNDSMNHHQEKFQIVQLARIGHEQAVEEEQQTWPFELHLHLILQLQSQT